MRKIGTARQFIVLLLLVAFLLPGFPSFAPEDASRDNEVDLRDNILLVQAFTDAAQADVHLDGDLRKLLSSLYVTAGLKTLIKAESQPNFSSTMHLDFPCLVSCPIFLWDMLFHNSMLSYGENFYPSLLIPPETPPPRFSMV